MNDCIFTSYCTNTYCTDACPIMIQSDYLMERTSLLSNSDCFKLGKSKLDNYISIYNCKEYGLVCVESKNINTCIDALCYIGVCNLWKGSKLHCKTYRLKFSEYIQDLKDSWSSKVEKEELQYKKIWSSSSDVLIISNLDFVIFKDFECQILLNILQDREDYKRKTFVVVDKISSLVGDGMLFSKFLSVLKEAKYKK